MLGVLQRAVEPGLETAYGTDQHESDPLTLIYQRGQPLVDVADIQHHLDLLGVFQKLHHAVDAAGIVVDLSTSKLPIMSPAQRLFLARAQHRFELWTTNILERPEREGERLLPEEIPPVDVLLLLHVYMLSPVAYREDVIRVYPCLARMGSFPWKNIHSLIETSTFEMTGTPAQIRLWESATAEPFGPPITTMASDTVDVTCPRCLSSSNALWKADDGKGFGEIGFSHVCPQCALTIDSDALCVSKFLKDLSAGKQLARTALDKDGMEDAESAREVSDEIRETLGGAAALNGDRFAWKMSNIKQTLLGDVSENNPFHEWLSYVLSAYTHFGKASIDLKDAGLRQGRFIQTMHDILWTGPGSTFPGKEQALIDAVASYERYFALTKTHSYGLIPTLDVDLAFHTHLLTGPIYAHDCFSILGRFLNHDDSESNPEIYRNNVTQSVDIWNRVYGKGLSPQYTPVDGPGLVECLNCGGIHPNSTPQPTKPKSESRSVSDNPSTDTIPAGNNDGGSLEGHSDAEVKISHTTEAGDNTYLRGLPPLYCPGGPRTSGCSKCSAAPTKPKPKPEPKPKPKP